MNNIQVTGRLTRNAEIRRGENYIVATYTVAVNRGKDKPADFIDCKAFGKAAETAEKYFVKGLSVGVCGALHIETFDKKDGTKGKAVYIDVSWQEMLEKPSGNTTEPTFTIDDNKDDLPF